MPRYGIEIVSTDRDNYYVVADLPDGSFRKGPMGREAAMRLANDMKRELLGVASIEHAKLFEETKAKVSRWDKSRVLLAIFFILMIVWILTDLVMGW